MWAIANYYKDQDQDLEKYKLICRFVNPEAARHIWDADQLAEAESSSDSDYRDFLSQIKKHTKEDISEADLASRIANPEEYDVDKIERVN